MQTQLDKRRVFIFLGFAFGIAWLTALAIALTGGLVASPKVAGSLTLALILMAVPMMGAPAIAHVLTRLVTREGWRDMWLRPNFRRGWRYWALAWILPALLTVLGGALYFLFMPSDFDPQLGVIQRMLAGSPTEKVLSPWAVMAIQTLQAILIAPLINSLFTFGEEFGWRAYLMPKLMVLGSRKAMLISGVIWGVWHWPVIFMGYEYAFNYPGSPWAGPLLFCWITLGFGTLLSWLAWRGKSVWPAVIGHAAINGIAGLSALALNGQPNMLIGPTPVGVIGSIGFSILAVILLFRSSAWKTDDGPAGAAPSVSPLDAD